MWYRQKTILQDFLLRANLGSITIFKTKRTLCLEKDFFLGKDVICAVNQGFAEVEQGVLILTGIMLKNNSKVFTVLLL